MSTIGAAVRPLLVVASLAATLLPAHAQQPPQRIVSTNQCTDQLLMRLVEPERITSMTWLSWDKDATPPEFRRALELARPNHALAEQVLMLDPDLVVGGTFSARFSNELMQRLGKNVVLLEPENSFEDWYRNIRVMGQAVGESERAEALISDFKTKLAALQAEIPPGEMPIYASLQINHWMPGRDTLYTQIVNAGGFRTAGQAVGFSGYRAIPLEQLVQMDISLISTNTRNGVQPSLARQSLNHPLLRRLAERAVEEIEIPARYIACPTPEVLDMISELIQTRKRIDRARASAAPQALPVQR